MPKFEQPIVVPKGTVFDTYRELTPQESATLESATLKTKERPDNRMPGTTREQLDRAREIFGSDFLGPEAVENVWGVRLEAKDIPAIPFSFEELLRAKELGQQLVLRVNKVPDGSPLTMQKANELIQPKLTQGGKGKLLLSVDWYANEEFYTTETPESSWALVSKGVIPNSTSKNYLNQTEALASYVKNEVFQGGPLPREYSEALHEFDRKKAAIKPLIDSNWEEAAKQLSELKINQLTRPNPVDVVYDVATNVLNNDERHLNNIYAWTERRYSDGELVDVGDADAGGAHVDALEPGPRHDDLGVSFSRSR